MRQKIPRVLVAEIADFNREPGLEFDCVAFPRGRRSRWGWSVYYVAVVAAICWAAGMIGGTP